MRGRNTRTAGYRVFLSVLIVKSDIEFFVWFVAENDDIHLACRGDHRSSDVVSVIAAHPSAIFINRRGRRLDDPREFRLLTGFRQDQIIDAHFGKIIRSISGTTRATIIKIDRKLLLDDYS